MNKIFSNVLVLCIATMILTSCGPTTTTIKPGEWDLFPNPNTMAVHPEEDIVFKLTPNSPPETANSIVINFGDGESETHQLNCHGESGKVKCSPIFVTHRYITDYVYRLNALFDDGNQAGKDMTFIIPPRYLTDEELLEAAIQDMIEQLEEGINVTLLGDRNQKLAISSLRDANFEYMEDDEDLKDIQLVQKIMQRLVKDDYIVLEKSPQALVRLAHEAVVRVNKDTQELDATYLPYLEYGLKTQYGGANQPFVYAIELSGVDDRRASSEIISSAESLMDQKKGLFSKFLSGGDDESSTSKVAENIFEKVLDGNRKEYQDRPLLFAKFDTANYLIVINRIEDPKVERTAPIYYSTKYNTEMIGRTASLTLNIRILNRNGTIEWIKNIQGKAEDQVIPQFVPASLSQEEKEQGNGFLSVISSFLKAQ